MKLFSSRSSSSASRRGRTAAGATTSTDRVAAPPVPPALSSSGSSSRGKNTQQGSNGGDETEKPNNMQAQRRQPQQQEQQLDQQRQSSSSKKREEKEEEEVRGRTGEETYKSDSDCNEASESLCNGGSKDVDDDDDDDDDDEDEGTIDEDYYDDDDDTSISCTITSSVLSPAVGGEGDHDDDEDDFDDDYDDYEDYDEYDEDFLDDYEYDENADVFTLIIEEGESDDEGSSSSSSSESNSDDDDNSSFDRYANDNDHRELYGDSGTLSSSEDEGESVSSSTLITTGSADQEATKNCVGVDGDKSTSISGPDPKKDTVDANRNKAKQDPINATDCESSDTVGHNAAADTAKHIGDDTTVLSNASFNSFLRMVKNGEVKSMRPIQNGKVLDRTEDVDQFLQKVEGASKNRVPAQRSNGEHKEDPRTINQDGFKKKSSSFKKGWRKNFLKFTSRSRNRSKQQNEQQVEVRGSNETKKSRSLFKEASKKDEAKEGPNASSAKKVPLAHPKSTSKVKDGSTAIVSEDEIDELVAMAESISQVHGVGTIEPAYVSASAGGRRSSNRKVPDDSKKPMPIEYNDDDGEQVTLQPPLERVNSEESYSLAEYLFMQALSMNQSAAEPNEELILLDHSPQKPVDDARQAVCNTKSLRSEEDAKMPENEKKVDETAKDTAEKEHDREEESTVTGHEIPLTASFSGKMSTHTTKENEDEKDAAYPMAGQEIPLSPSLEESFSSRQPESASVETTEQSVNEETVDKTTGEAKWKIKVFGSRTRSKEVKGTGFSLLRSEGSLQKFRSFRKRNPQDQIESTPSLTLQKTVSNTRAPETDSSERQEKLSKSRKSTNSPRPDGHSESQSAARYIEDRENHEHSRMGITKEPIEEPLCVLSLHNACENATQSQPTAEENDPTSEGLQIEMTDDLPPTEVGENLGWMSLLQPFIAFGAVGESRAPINEPRETSVDPRRTMKDDSEDDLTYLGIEASSENCRRGQNPIGASYTVPLRDIDKENEPSSTHDLSSRPPSISSRRSKKQVRRRKASTKTAGVASQSSKKSSSVVRDKKTRRNNASMLSLHATNSSDLILSSPMSRLPSGSSTNRSNRFRSWRGKKKNRRQKATVDKIGHEPSLLYVMTTKKKMASKKGVRRRGNGKNKTVAEHHRKVFYTVEVGKDIPEN